MIIALAACSPTTSKGSGPDAARGSGATDSGSGSSDTFCIVNECSCPADVTCSHTCAPGSSCHVKAMSGDHVHVTCTATDLCEVESVLSASCQVDCAGRTDCQVTCPGHDCTVTNVPPTDPNVTCGGIGPATRVGTTATCP